MNCLCPDAITQPSDLCPVHGCVPLADRDPNWLWLDDDRDPDEGSDAGLTCLFAFLGLLVGIAAAVRLPAKLIGTLLNKEKHDG